MGFEAPDKLLNFASFFENWTFEIVLPLLEVPFVLNLERLTSLFKKLEYFLGVLSFLELLFFVFKDFLEFDFDDDSITLSVIEPPLFLVVPFAPGSMLNYIPALAEPMRLRASIVPRFLFREVLLLPSLIEWFLSVERIIVLMEP